MNFQFFEGNAKEWDFFLLGLKNEEFLQSYEWGEFQAKEGNLCLRIVGETDGTIGYLAQGFVHSLPLGLKYLYLPHSAPLGEQELSEFLQFLKQQGFIFVRFEPVREISYQNFKTLPTHHRQYEYTSVLDLTRPEEEILQSFHEKTRYNIRLAAKKGIKIVEEKNSDIFWPLLKETYERDNIKSHSEKYYRDFIALDGCTQLTAYYNEIPLASLLLYTFGKTTVYVHGASSSEHRNLMAPYLLQWEAMTRSRARGTYFYDLGGVAKPENSDSSEAETFFHSSWNKQDKLSRVTRFKAGFDGTIKQYAKAHDVVFSPVKYNLYMLAKKFL